MIEQTYQQLIVHAGIQGRWPGMVMHLRRPLDAENDRSVPLLACPAVYGVR